MNLRSLLVVGTVYDLQKARTLHTIDQLRRAGATCKFSYGVSDVALARCVAAAKALEALRRRHRFVLWLDSDIVLSGTSVERLILWVQELEVTLRRVKHACPRLRPFSYAAVSARYLQQNGPALAAQYLQRSDGQELLQCRPVYCGLGAHMQSVESFVNACHAAPEIPTRICGSPVPAITASGPMQIDGRTVWSSEDSTYCAWLEQCGTLTYLVPVRAGHIPRADTEPRWPDRDSPTLDELERAEKASAAEDRSAPPEASAQTPVHPHVAPQGQEAPE